MEFEYTNGLQTGLCTEYEKQEAVKRQRRLRLCQVREQSKEIAAHVRKRVCDERQRQLEQIEKTKAAELECWRQKRLDNVSSIYSNCLAEVGQAHRNAAEEIEHERRLELRRQEAKVISAKRGNEAARKRLQQLKEVEEKAAKSLSARQKKVVVSKPAKTVIGKRAKIQTSGETIASMGLPLKSTASTGGQRQTPTIEATVDEIELTDTDASNVSISDDESVDIIKQKWSQDKPSNYADYMKKKEQAKSSPTRLSGSSSDSSDSEIEQNKFKEKQKIDKENHSKMPTHEEEKDYNFKVHANTSKEIETAPSSPAFRQVSDLLRTQAQSKMPKNLPKKSSALKDAHKSAGNKYNKSFEDAPSSMPISLKPSFKSVSKSARKVTKSPQKVKYYDHDNRYSREYEQPKNVVTREDQEFQPYTRNAMDAAKDEIILEEQRFKAIEEIRKRDAIRAEQAKEKETLRKDYELLSQQLKEADDNNSKKTKPISIMDQASSLLDHQLHMNNAFEQILKRPTMITCPEVVRQPQDLLRTSSTSLNVGKQFDQSSDSSSSSIVLGYINERCEEVAKNIHEIKRNDKLENLKQLKDLQRRINEQKILLNSEIAKNQDDASELGKILSAVSELDKERVQVIRGIQRDNMINPKEAENVEPEKRTKSINKTKNVNIHVDAKTNAVTMMDDSNSSHSDYPLQIVIKVNDGHGYNSPRKRSTLIDNGAKRNKKKIATRTMTQSPVKTYPQTPAPIKTLKKTATVDAQDESSTSTTYKNLPAHLQTDLAKALDPKPSHKRQSNPLLKQYITRLLGMSRQSIDQLGVSSATEIETPSSSIINVSNNMTLEDIKRARRFVDDNYSFVNQFEESLKDRQKKPPAEKIEKPQKLKKDSTKMWLEEQKRIDQIKDLELQKLRQELKELKQQKVSEQNTKTKEVQKRKDSQSTKSAQPGVIGLSEEEAIDRYNEIAENASKRIANLNEMLQKVREDKQKVIGSPLTSSDGSARNSTEYYELPQKPSAGMHDELPVGNLQQSKLIGISRDSGIFSRPLTSQDDNAVMPQEVESTPKDDKTVESKNKPPPAAVKRFSPQLPEQNDIVVHELSTIPEVETPGTSRINFSGNGSLELNKENNSIHYQRPPGFEDYLRQKNLDATEFDPDASTNDEENIRKYMEISTKGDDLRYQQFVQRNAGTESSAIRDFDETLKSRDESAQKVKKIPESKGGNTSVVLDSRTLTNEDVSDIPDIESELLKRKIITEPFSKNGTSEESDNTKENHFPEKLENVASPISGQERFKVPNSPKKKVRSKPSRGAATTQLDGNNKENLSGVGLLQSSSISLFEDDLMKNSLKWAGSMLKKTKEAQALLSSSESSATVDKTNNATNDSTASGRPINLREFLTNELQKRSSSTSVSSNDESSLSSALLRSLLFASNKSTSQPIGATQQHTTQRTSTPVKTGTPSLNQDELFSGESRISSVHYNSSHVVDSGSSSSNQDKLTVPDFKLNLEKYGLSSGGSESKTN